MVERRGLDGGNAARTAPGTRQGFGMVSDRRDLDARDSDRRDLEAICWLWERLAVENGEGVDRGRVRRALEEASAIWPGDVSDSWWRWLLEGAERPGHRARAVDCTVPQLLEIGREGAQWIAHFGEDQWLGVASQQGGRLLVVRPLVDDSAQWQRIDSLRSELSARLAGGTVRCVVIEPSLSVSHDDSAASTRPWRRILYWLHTEWSDIWMVLVFAVTIGLLSLATPLAVEALVNTVAFGRFLQPVIILAIMLLAFLSFSAALRSLQTFVVEIIQRRLFARVASDLAYRLPRVQIEALDEHPPRETVNYFFETVTLQKVIAQFLLDGIALVVGALIGMSVLAFYHPWLLGFDVLLLAMITIAIMILGRGAVATAIKESKAKYHMAAWLQSLADNVSVFHHTGGAELAWERTDQLTYEYLAARRKHFHILIRQVVFALAMQALASTILLGLGGWLVITGQLTLGQLVAAELIVTMIVGSVAKLGKHMESYYDLCAAVDKLGVLFDLPVERQDGLLGFPDGASDGSVVVEHISYAYGAGPNVLSGCNLRLDPGDRLALLGPSGTGKSTLLDILFGLRPPTSGHLTLHGIDPRELRTSVWRRVVALAREPSLFAGTLAENVHLDRPDVSATDVRHALAHVGLTQVIAELSDGLDTEIPSNGVPLSTVQIRKLILAQAIVGQPRLLLVDGLLDGLPDADAVSMTRWLCDAQRPWKLLLVTGRQDLAAICKRQVDMASLMSKSTSAGGTDGARWPETPS